MAGDTVGSRAAVAASAGPGGRRRTREMTRGTPARCDFPAGPGRGDLRDHPGRAAHRALADPRTADHREPDRRLAAQAGRPSDLDIAAARRCPGRLPAQELVDAGLVLVGGTLLLAPGFITDVVGFFFILPWTRPLTRRLLVWLAGPPDRPPHRPRGVGRTATRAAGHGQTAGRQPGRPHRPTRPLDRRRRAGQRLGRRPAGRRHARGTHRVGRRVRTDKGPGRVAGG